MDAELGWTARLGPLGGHGQHGNSAAAVETKDEAKEWQTGSSGIQQWECPKVTDEVIMLATRHGAPFRHSRRPPRPRRRHRVPLYARGWAGPSTTAEMRRMSPYSRGLRGAGCRWLTGLGDVIFSTLFLLTLHIEFVEPMLRRTSAPASVREVPSPKAAMAEAAGARLAPLDGMRAVACVSLVAFHTVLICTMFHPFNSTNDLAFRASPLFGILTSAAFQVEMMMVLSGFLLGRRQRQLCGAKCPGDTPGGPVATAVKVARAVWTYALHRAVRLWPMLLACVALQTLLGDAATTSVGGWLLNTAQVLGFVTPIDLRRGSVSLLATWAVALDFQCGVLLYGALELARRTGQRHSPETARRRCRWTLRLMSMAALVIRFMLYDPEQGCELRMRQLVHFDHAVTPTVHARDWIFRTYSSSPTAAVARMGADSGDWSGTASAPGYYEAHSEEAAAFGTMWTQLYAAPHMRFGAMVLGALLAFLLPEEGAAASAPAKRRSFFSHRSPLLTMQSACATGLRTAVILYLAVTPFVLGMSTDLAGWAPWATSLTVMLRAWAATGTCTLLLCAMAPASSVWHSPRIAAALSWPGWKPIADRSYGINMVHIRVILEVALRVHSPQEGAAPLAPAYVLSLLATGFALSAAVATALSPLEDLLRRGLQRALLGQ